MNVESEKLFEQMVKLIQEENKKQTDVIQSSFRAEISEIKSDIIEVKSVIKEEQKNTKALIEQNKTTLNKCEFFERTLKKNNIIIFGLNNSKTENLVNYTVEQLNRLLDLNLTLNQINNIRAVGDPQKLRPIVVEFVSFLTKLEVLKCCKKLKGTQISINQDLTKKDRDIRKRLLVHQREARSKNLCSYIKGNKLVINDDIYTIEELETNVNTSNTNGEEIEVQSGSIRRTASAPSTPILLHEETDQEEPRLDEDNKATKKRKITQADSQKVRPTTRHFSQQSASAAPNQGTDILPNKNPASIKTKK